jgi:L-fuconate dehydratase
MAMPDMAIRSVSTYDARFPLPPGAGTDSVHTNSEYSFAVTSLRGENGLRGTGIALTLGDGNKLVCEAIEMLARPLAGVAIEELMGDFGRVSRKLADDPSLRWLGPHKGVVHLALASITNACFDFWAKSRCKPLWKLLLDLIPSEVVRLLDLSYLEEVLSEQNALELLEGQQTSRSRRIPILQSGYPGYDTSVGWMAYDDQKVRDLTQRALESGFRAFKLKVGSDDERHDLRRAAALRECIGESGALMFDANQRWNLPVAIRMSRALAVYQPFVDRGAHTSRRRSCARRASAGNRPHQDRGGRAHS